MNSFFQRLLSRFLCETLSIKKSQTNTPSARFLRIRRMQSPEARARHAQDQITRCSKRINYVVSLTQNTGISGNEDFRPNVLYQLSVYALAAPSQVSVLLYATMSAQAEDERIEIRQPLTWSSKGPASVILRPETFPED